MIIINQIFDETLKYTREINLLKARFWQIFDRPEHASGVQQVFAALTGVPGRTTLEKPDFSRAVGLSNTSRPFPDHFYFLNSANENFLTPTDLLSYLKRYLVTQAAPDNYTNPPSPMVAQVSQILQREVAFFNAIQPLKERLRDQFPNENRYIDFLLSLFHDLSTYSPRAKLQAIDFQKFNVDLRQKHNFPLFSMAEFALLQSYFDLNCDCAFSQEEFLYALMDYPLIQRYFQLRLHEQVKAVAAEPFLPFNRNDVNVQYNLNNFVLGDLEPAGNQTLRQVILKGSHNPQFDPDAVVVGANMVFRQPNYNQILRGQVPQVVNVVDPNQPSSQDFPPSASLQDVDRFGEHSQPESRRVVLKDIKMTQLTVDEAARRPELISQIEEVHSRDYGSERKPVPQRQGLDESGEANMSHLDSGVRNNVAGFRY